jgi:hypothetical protein
MGNSSARRSETPIERTERELNKCNAELAKMLFEDIPQFQKAHKQKQLTEQLRKLKAEEQSRLKEEKELNKPQK